MRRYRDFWVTTAGVLATVGLWEAVASWPVSGLLFTFTTAAVCTAAMVWAATLGKDRPWALRRVVAWGMAASSCLIALAGLTLLLGAAAAPCLAMMVACSPPVVRRLRDLLKTQHPRGERARQSDSPGAPPVTRADPAPPVSEPKHDELWEPTPLRLSPRALDDAQLCWAWRISYVTLQRSTTPMQRLRVVQQRQHYLDELERRNPAGVAAWLASGARAAGDPSRYVISTHGPHRPPCG